MLQIDVLVEPHILAGVEGTAVVEAHRTQAGRTAAVEGSGRFAVRHTVPEETDIDPVEARYNPAVEGGIGLVEVRHKALALVGTMGDLEEDTGCRLAGLELDGTQHTRRPNVAADNSRPEGAP